MAAKKNHSKKGRKGSRRRARRTLRMGGGGWKVDVGQMINPGNAVNVQYAGPGKDCAGTAVRPGTIGSLASNLNSGLPGTSPSPASRGQLGGATQLGSGGPVVGVRGVYLSDAEHPAKYPQAYTNITAKLPVTTTYRPSSQSGGRYGFTGAVLNPTNGVGSASYGVTASIPCEIGSFNRFNPEEPQRFLDPGGSRGHGVQGLTTALMKGGRRKNKKHNAMNGKNHSKCPICHKTTRKNKQSGGMAQGAPLQKFIGDVDSMSYNVPTAGYSIGVMNPMVQNNPLDSRNPYDARGGTYVAQVGYPSQFNQACLKTN